MLNLADIYTDYLIAQNKHATATGLADLMPDELSHDQITRLLNKTPQTSKDLWLKIKADVREYEGLDDGVLALDDMRKRRYLGRYFAHPMMQNRRAKRDDYKPSAVRVTQRYVP
ncbi:hypothetical protein PsalMR5_01485 [Piscirickettsia salmonis]|uniref:hypothetical protein n=1 Tax=Piscirickettsia salmonis TaxID=1238 RepID=UPI0012BAB2C4|nr:hypothetical protein [Piscirickettsia salmonis]QGP54048.1 hypothetical protein PsalSR1_01476 [Piscirickettsia salmonis]QGP63625.1 hypothetical protein PsalMR5_01485 [Piscirickettsia salmonis]